MWSTSTADGFQYDDREFMAAFDALMTRWSKNARAGIRRYGEAARDAMARHIHSVDGELLSALVVDDHLVGDKPYIEVGTDESQALEPHGLYVEFGTIHMAPRPYARPGLLEAESEFTVDP